jgi:acetyl-CoA decarbonylase/synthase complex subunit gamma
MALTGLDIFKLLPKTNCKKCGKPTCLAFAMALAQKRAKLEECPDVSDEAKEKLAAAAAPPMLKVTFGEGDNQVTLGQETVCFRHEEKFHSPTVIGVTVSDKLSGSDLKDRLDSINALKFERIGIKIGVQAIAIVNDSGSAETFAQTTETVNQACDHALILVTKSPEAMTAAAKAVKDNIPLLAQATPETATEMAKIAKENNCPLVASADSLEALADLTEKIKAEGVEDIVLCPPAGAGGEMKSLLHELSDLRILALKKVFRPLGCPTISFVTGDDDTQVASAVSLICKYSGIVVLDTVEPYAILPILTAVMNIYTDPQKPVQVEPKVYSIGEPDENAPVMFTTNFSLTYYTVESDVEASRVPSYIIVVDTEGTSVLTAYSGDKLNEKTVADAIAKYKVESLVKHRKLIIPGYVAVMSGKIEEATNWEVMVGPRECSMLPKFLQEVWN